MMWVELPVTACPGDSRPYTQRVAGLYAGAKLLGRVGLMRHSLLGEAVLWFDYRSHTFGALRRMRPLTEELHERFGERTLWAEVLSQDGRGFAFARAAGFRVFTIAEDRWVLFREID